MGPLKGTDRLRATVKHKEGLAVSLRILVSSRGFSLGFFKSIVENFLCFLLRERLIYESGEGMISSCICSLFHSEACMPHENKS